MISEPTHNLVIVHTPTAQDLSDWVAVARKIHMRAPDIDVRIVNNFGRPDPDISAWQAQRPSLVFSPATLVNFRPVTGKIYVGRALDKAEQLRRLTAAGLPTPPSVELTPGISLDSAEWGDYVLVKPFRSSFGRGIKLVRPETVRSRFTELTRNGRERMLIQKLIDATDEGGRLYAFRVLMMFERALYANMHKQVEPRPPLAEIADRGTGFIAHNARGVEREKMLVDHADVLELAKRAARAVREFPVLGIDIIRERSTGDLYVLETNSGGNVWHLSSDMVARRQPSAVRQRKYGQFKALDIAADTLIEKTRNEASWYLQRAWVARSTPGKVG